MSDVIKSTALDYRRCSLAVLLFVFLAACGGGGGASGGSSGGTAAASPQMGGAIQGTSLDLTRAVSTLAGGAPYFVDPKRVVLVGGYLYVVDGNTIQRLEIATNQLSVFAGSSTVGSADGVGTSARFNGPKGIASDGTNLYVSDYATIRKIDISTATVTTIAGSYGAWGSSDGTGSTARFLTPMGLTVVNGTTLFVVDSGNSNIRMVDISTGAVTSYAGAVKVFDSVDGIGTAARFYQPTDITNDGTNLYVADWFNDTIRKIDISSALVTTYAGAAGVSGNTDGVGTAATFTYPRGITFGAGYLYVTTGLQTIRKIDLATATVSTMAGNSGVTGRADGVGSAATFNYPSGIASDGSTLYIVDTQNFVIRKIAIATADVTTLGVIPGADGTGPAASLSWLGKVTTDGTNLYVADTYFHTIRKIVIATGEVTTLAGTALQAGSADGTGANARFLIPSGITTDGTNLYVADSGNNTIRKIVLSTGAVTTMCGIPGSPGSSDGTGAAAQFNSPMGITTDNSYLYVADTGNQTIRKVRKSDCLVTTLAGMVGVIGAADGVGATARFNIPVGITTDGVSLYVADRLNHTIRKIRISDGSVTTLAGISGTSGSSDGIGAAARFFGPFDVTTDGMNLYVADTENHLIRKVVISTAEVTTLAGTTGVAGNNDATGSAASFHSPGSITTDGQHLLIGDSGNNVIRLMQ